MNWDEEVDVVCIEAGLGGLASAIATVDGGADVFVASSTAVDGACLVKVGPRVGSFVRLAGHGRDRYADPGILRSPFAPAPRWTGAPGMSMCPVSVVAEPSPEPSSRAVEPFIGARLRDWAARCLTSPYGWLYTRVAGPHTTTMRTCDGDAIEVVEVSTFKPGALEFHGSALADWLMAQARERGIEVHTSSPLQRIVFEDGQVVGAVVSTPDGPYAVRARHGVSVAPGGPQVAHRHAARTAGQRCDRAAMPCQPGGQPVRPARTADHGHRCAPTPMPSARTASCTPACTRRGSCRHSRGAAEKCTGTRPWASRDSIAPPASGRDSRNPCAR